jgi:flagellar motor switch protein FliN/FliY
LSGQAFLMMGREDVSKLTALTLASSSAGKGFSSPKFQEGFYYFLGTQVVQAIDEIKAFGDLGLKIGKLGSLPQEESLCIDIEIQHSKETFWGRLACPASFHQAFKTHFNIQPPTPLKSALAKQIDVTVRLELGQTELLLSQWQEVRVGDFILLDRCTFDPKTQKGTATLMLEQTSLLRARIKDNSLKIVDYAFYREEHNQMNPEMPPDEKNPKENFESEPSAEYETELPSDQNHLWTSENAEMEKLISPQEIPLTLAIEVARLRINLDKLLQLSPGNVLELSVKPEQGVDLVIGGKKVAKGELVKLGEMLGVKILQLGD